ncbi:MAG: hypothetical protein SGCHY_003927 [Lobulomycetales sp.]
MDQPRRSQRKRKEIVAAQRDNDEEASNHSGVVEEQSIKQRKRSFQQTQDAPPPAPVSAKWSSRTRHLMIPRKVLQAAAAHELVALVPVKLDIQIDQNTRIQDEFTWNITESLISPERFAEIMVQDLTNGGSIPHDTATVQEELVSLIATQIRTQCTSYLPAMESDAVPPRQKPRRRVNVRGVLRQSHMEEDIDPDSHSHIPEGPKGEQRIQEEEQSIQEEGQRIQEEEQDQEVYRRQDATLGDRWNDSGICVIVRVEFNVSGTSHFRDQFEWPLYAESDPTPEAFAAQVAADLGVGNEYAVRIASSIREQICLARMNYEDSMISSGVSAGNVYRTIGELSEWEPETFDLSPEEMERIAKEKDRETRRMRRNQRAGSDFNPMLELATRRSSETQPGSWKSSFVKPERVYMSSSSSTEGKTVAYQFYQGELEDVNSLEARSMDIDGKRALLSANKLPSLTRRRTSGVSEDILLEQLDLMIENKASLESAASDTPTLRRESESSTDSSASSASSSAPKKHRGFGASAQMFNKGETQQPI